MPQPTTGIVYPESDGHPMGEISVQVKWILALYLGFVRHFRDRDDVFVAADMFWYPVEGRPRVVTAPDIMFAFGRPKGDRPSYKQWEEGGVAPQVVIEVLSPSNTYPKRGKLNRFYDAFGVDEVYEYDPESRELFVQLRGGKQNSLRHITPIRSHACARLGVTFDIPPGEELRVRGPDGQPFPSWDELVVEAELAQVQIAAAKQRATEEARRAAEEARRAAEEARRAAEAERRAAEAERVAAEAKQEADRMKAKLRELGLDPDAL